MNEEYLDQFMPSAEMREYLKEKEIRVWNFINMIYYSPVSIEKKKEAFYTLYENAQKDNNTELAEESKACIDSIEAFLELLAYEGVFSVSLCCYNEEIHDTEYDFHCVCASIEDVLEYEKWDKQNHDIEQDELYWYSVEKWIKDEKGKYVMGGEFVLSCSEIILWDVEKVFKKDLDFKWMYSCTNINLPVPYKAGDILEINGNPFGPKMKMVILQVGDNRDCCCLQALSRDEEGLWHVGAVKHGMIGCYHAFPHFSPLYSIKKCTDVSQDKDGEIFLAIQKYLDGDETKGEDLCERFMYDMTDEELLEKCKEIF